MSDEDLNTKTFDIKLVDKGQINTGRRLHSIP